MSQVVDATTGEALKISWFRKPLVQVALTGFVCFLCPGMFNALNGMGGGGQLDNAISSRANTALYTTFAVIGFGSGTFLNYFGARKTLGFGGFGYALYAASFLSYNHTKNQGFVIFAGALLGVCAALLWCAQGTLMMSYPTEADKGKYIGVFWSIFNMGAVIGSLIPLGTNWSTTEVKPVADGTYVGFLVLMLCGAVLAFALVPIHKIVRSDGTRVQRVRHPSVTTELKGLYETLLTDPYILFLFPFFVASNWFYTYQNNVYNLYMFNTRTRAFTGLFYWLAQIFGAVGFGFFLDNKKMTRGTRARAGWVALFIFVNVIWGGGLKAQLGMSRPPDVDKAAEYYRGMDVFDKDFFWYWLLYVMYGFLDATWQTYAYWIMGALSNEPRKLAYFAGYYKGIQSAGAAIVWGLDSSYVSYDSLFGSSWALNVVGLIVALPVLWKRIHETELSDEDLVAKPAPLDPIAVPADKEEKAVVEAEQTKETTAPAAT